MGQKQEHLLLCKLGGGQFRKRISVRIPGTKILVMPPLIYMPEEILGKNEKILRKKLTFLLGSLLPKYKRYPKILVSSPVS